MAVDDAGYAGAHLAVASQREAYAAANARLIAARLCPGESNFVPSNGTSGIVVGQSPRAGVAVAAWTRVQLAIGARGPYAEIVAGRTWPSQCRG